MLMLEQALVGSRRYWLWIIVLAAFVALGLWFYLIQLQRGLEITGMSRDITWGLYIAQFTFFVGVAASAVTVVLPYYLHDYKHFAKVTILGEFLAIGGVVMCMLFIFVDMGQPARVINVMLYPTPHSMMFWDMVSLTGYLLLNATIAFTTVYAERKGVLAPNWLKPLIFISIPWAISIHTVTAFLYSGLAARPFWMTAVLAPRFLASAFASGPALLVLLCMILRRCTSYDPGETAIGKLLTIVTYGMTISVFLTLVELFTALYSAVPEHTESFRYFFVGIGGADALVPWTWASLLLGCAALVMLYLPWLRSSSQIMAVACVCVFLSLWMEKGMGLIVGGFVPSPLGAVTEYRPTRPELAIVAGIWATGALIVTVFYKITVALRSNA